MISFTEFNTIKFLFVCIVTRHDAFHFEDCHFCLSEGHPLWIPVLRLCRRSILYVFVCLRKFYFAFFFESYFQWVESWKCTGLLLFWFLFLAFWRHCSTVFSFALFWRRDVLWSLWLFLLIETLPALILSFQHWF